MSTQRVLLMLFVTVAVAWMVGYAEGKHAADGWWQADEAKKIQTVWDIAPCSTGCSGIVPNDGTFCGDNSGCYTMKDGVCVSGDCFGKPTDDTDKFACPGKGPANAQELAWWRAHATPEHPCLKEPKQ